MATKNRQGRSTLVEFVILLRRNQRQELLLRSSRGAGMHKLSIFGGDVRTDQTLEEAAAYSLQALGMQVEVGDLMWLGVLTCIYDARETAVEINVFEVESWGGELRELEEDFAPAWIASDAVPAADLCTRDQQWLNQYLGGQLAPPFWGRLHFAATTSSEGSAATETLLESTLSPLTPLLHSPGSSPAPGNALVVSTVSFRLAPGGCVAPLESFIRYHLRKGFAMIMLFIDNASDKLALQAAQRFPASRVVIKVRGQELTEEQRARCVSFERFAPLANSDVSARQVLDAELAMASAPELGCSWVVCLDSDELFHTKASSVVPHFESLAAEGVDQMTYLNHEGVPEVAEIGDYFAAVTLFRRHHFAVPLSGPARSGLRFWMDRSKRGQYMLFYDNGKSACRVGLGAKPRSQHLWDLPQGCRSCTALADPRRMDVEGYRDCADPCILHFPICGLNWFLAKYQTLGSFTDTWLGTVPLPQCFHTDARDLCAAGGDALRSKFCEEVLLDDSEEVQRQLQCGTCLRIEEHARLLDSVETDYEGSVGPQRAKRSSAPTKGAPLDAGFQGIERGWVLSKAMGFL